jgi:Zn-finger in ubiquitin-hydrolases and other protein
MVGRRRGQGQPDDESRDRPLRMFRQRRRAGVQTQSPRQCEHLEAMPARVVDPKDGCEDHQPDDGPVVHLRACLTCGHVGCCDSSAPRHATAHANSTGHPVIQSAEAGENWRWCYVHELLG